MTGSRFPLPLLLTHNNNVQERDMLAGGLALSITPANRYRIADESPAYDRCRTHGARHRDPGLHPEPQPADYARSVAGDDAGGEQLFVARGDRHGVLRAAASGK